MHTRLVTEKKSTIWSCEWMNVVGGQRPIRSMILGGFSFFPVLIRPRSKRGIIKTYYEKIRTCSHMASSEAVQTSKKTQASLMWSIAARVFSVTKWHAQIHVRTLLQSISTTLITNFSSQVLFYPGPAILFRIMHHIMQNLRFDLVGHQTVRYDTIDHMLALLCFP